MTQNRHLWLQKPSFGDGQTWGKNRGFGFGMLNGTNFWCL